MRSMTEIATYAMGTPPRLGDRRTTAIRLFRYASVSVIATAVGAVPSFEVNRRWVWSNRARRSLLRQIVPFCSLTVIGLVVSTAAVGLVAAHTARWNRIGHTVAIEAANVAAYGSLWVVQFILLDRFLFGQPSRPSDSAPLIDTGTGSRTENTAPPSAPGDAIVDPPWESTIAATMDSPSPVPPVPRDRDASAR